MRSKGRIVGYAAERTMANEAKHTPGPWRIGSVSMNDGSLGITHDEYRLVIANVNNGASLGDFVTAAMRGRKDFGAPDTAKTQWANARLIAAAPDLYEALKGVLRVADRKTVEFDAARAALAKVEGKQLANANK